MTLIEALTGPDGRAWRSHSIRFYPARSASRKATVDSVVLLVNRIGDVGVEIEAYRPSSTLPRPAVSVPHRFHIHRRRYFLLWAPVTVIVVRRRSRPANTGTGVTVEIDSHCLMDITRRDSNCQWEFGRVIIILSPRSLLFFKRCHLLKLRMFCVSFFMEALNTGS